MKGWFIALTDMLKDMGRAWRAGFSESHTTYSSRKLTPKEELEVKQWADEMCEMVDRHMKETDAMFKKIFKQ